MSLAAEAELGALYINAKEAVYFRQILNAMDHPQPRTPIQMDQQKNTTETHQSNGHAIPLASRL
jgi:hypothetical protein